MYYNENEYLQVALESGMIDEATLQAQVDMAERQKYLKGHNIWQGKNRLWYTKLDRDGGKRLVKRTTKEAVEQEIIQYEKALHKQPTVQQVFYQFIDQKLRYKDISKSTYDRYAADYNRYIKGREIENMQFCKLTEEYLENFIRCTIADFELTSKAYAGLRTILRGMLLFAKGKYTLISAKSFFGDMQFSKNTFRKNIVYKEQEVFSEEEITKVMEYLEKENTLHSLGIMLAFQTGVRVGELTAVKKDDIVDENGIVSIHIQRTETKYKDENGEYVIGVKDYPKSSAGDRYVYCTDRAVEIINEILKRTKGKEYLFENENGRFHERMFDGVIRKCCRHCGISEKSMHKIRKTYGTTLIDGGVDEAIIIEQMGHSDIHCTKQYYYFSNKNREKKQQQLSKAICF
ncbi:MAG: site-specific integrase [Lachnospiraceae bacterium]|nr:site-specific integrase [Lachnospiraceae bacterium]